MFNHRFLLACLIALPLCTFSVGAISEPVPQSEESMPEDVEEPDAADMDMLEHSKTEESKIPAATSTPAPVVTPEKKPGEGGITDFNMVVLQGLNKVTARSSRIEVPIGSVVRFGTLEINARRCWQAAPDERPENAALLEIFEIKQGETPKQIFLGWMFSSSPGLSSLEHPFYDITVVKCDKIDAKKL